MSDGVDPWLFTALRVLMGAPLLVFWAFLFDRRHPNVIPPKPSWQLIFWQAFIGVTTPMLTFALALSVTSVTAFSLITPFSPILTTVFAIAMHLERSSWLKYAGLACGLVGIMCSLAKNIFTADWSPAAVSWAWDDLVGIGNALLNVIAYSFSTNLQHIGCTKYGLPAVSFAAWTTAVGGIIILAVTAPLGCWSSDKLAALTWQDWLYTSYGGFIQTGCNFALTTYSIKGIGRPSIIAAYGLVQSFLVPIFAVFLLGESIVAMQIVGGLFCVGGLVCGIAAKLQEERKRRRALLASVSPSPTPPTSPPATGLLPADVALTMGAPAVDLVEMRAATGAPSPTVVEGRVDASPEGKFCQGSMASSANRSVRQPSVALPPRLHEEGSSGAVPTDGLTGEGDKSTPLALQPLR